MRPLPHEVERWGPELRSWVERQLLADLEYYGAIPNEPAFDWSQVVQEGHFTQFRGRMLESLSDISVRDTDDTVLAEGWMDFVLTSSEAAVEPSLFWLFLSVRRGEALIEVKADPNVPLHLWAAISDTQLAYIANTDSKWLRRDPKVIEWRRRNRLTSDEPDGPAGHAPCWAHGPADSKGHAQGARPSRPAGYRGVSGLRRTS